jgi:hypothetical protein
MKCLGPSEIMIALHTDSFCCKTNFQSMEKAYVEKKKMAVMIKVYQMSWESNDESS